MENKLKEKINFVNMVSAIVKIQVFDCDPGSQQMGKTWNETSVANLYYFIHYPITIQKAVI